MKRLIAANVFAALPAAMWVYLFLAMSAHYAALPANGYSGAWDFWVYFPLGMALGLMASIVAFNFIRRRPRTLAAIAGAALLPILPYGMMISGGV